MPRSLVIGNGQVLATFDDSLQMRDLYYPYVGMEDQTTYGNVHHVGVMVEGKGFSWFGDGQWKVTVRYDEDTLSGNSEVQNDTLGIRIQIQDYVHPVHNVLLRHFTVQSTDGQTKKVRLFFNHDFHIYGDKQKDTAFYEPYTNCMIHYREKRYFLVGGQTNKPTECVVGAKGGKYASILRSMEELNSCGISSYTTGKADYRGLEGTWRDAEDGELSRHPIEQGSVDSTVAIHCIVNAEPTEVVLWLCLGKSLDEVLKLQQIVLLETPERLHRNAKNYWKSWSHKIPRSFGSLSQEVISLYYRSLLMIRTHVDNHGGIVAAADADIMAFNRDTYTYVWPRDGAFVSLALDRAGYGEVTRKFFKFCTQIQMPDGYMLHKYNPDGSPGSSWHAWFRDGEPQLPIQEDETALVIYAMWKHFLINQDFEFLQDLFERFIRKAAQFIVDFREEETGLPLPSYDPWEEHRGIFTYTTATTIAGLNAASQIADILGHHQHAERYKQTAETMKQAMLTHLYDEETKRFYKKIKRKDGKTIEKDLTPDMSMSALWLLDVLPADNPRVVSTMNQLVEMLTVHTQVGGLARYTNDHYQEVVPVSKEIPGNPWIITTLWHAQWKIALAKDAAELDSAKKMIEWVQKYASPAGILAEQLHPHTGAPLSVAPLTWSHATYIETVLKYLEKEQSLIGQQMYKMVSGE